MEALTKDEMNKILGGGWVILANGQAIYIPDEDENSDEDDIIFI